MNWTARFASVGIAFLLLTAPTFAQGQRVVIEQSAAPRQEGFVRVQSTISLFVPGPTGDSEEAQKARDRARRMVYEMAARECDLLREAIAKDCRLESVNSNVGRQGYNQQQPDGYTVNGTMNLQITLK